MKLKLLMFAHLHAYALHLKGMRVVADRRPRPTFWIPGKPRSQEAKRASPGYIQSVQAEARKHFSEPLRTSTIDVEIL